MTKKHISQGANTKDFRGGAMGDSALPMQGVQVWSLVGEPDLHATTKDPVCHN